MSTPDIARNQELASQLHLHSLTDGKRNNRDGDLVPSFDRSGQGIELRPTVLWNRSIHICVHCELAKSSDNRQYQQPIGKYAGAPSVEPHLTVKSVHSRVYLHPNQLQDVFGG